MKQEYILLSLYYNTIDNYIIISPDANDLMQNPYKISTDICSGNFEYGVEIIFAELESDQELINLLNKLYTKWQKKHKHLIQFIQPATGKEKFYVNIEIISGTDFDMDNIYIEYEIKIPENMKCEGILNGRTHVSKASQHGDDMLWTYGHMIELDIDIDVELDWWGRHRTEGYCYLPISLIPGYYKEVLRCSRPEEINKVEANTRRFFVGGCHLINDLEVLSKPQLQNANFTYTATGNLHLRYGIIKQANSPDTDLAGVPSGVPTSSVLLQGAEAVLREYSHARAKLDAATKHIVCGS
ncbi:Meckel syndrome type 1 protein-like [Papilio machaon]|uniref:Meckel syndrome type 1 protein-like n=1 Tax=Papilio machaon TaxID=76193 RepID=A0A0N0PC76_PAPMA|nr:Meckel syndrome type 1 protein-like [Papilio machaon]